MLRRMCAASMGPRVYSVPMTSKANVQFTTTDSGGLSTSESITITVGDVNRLPVLSPIGGKTVMEGLNLQFNVNGTDLDGGDVLTFSTGGLPPGATFSGQTFSWTPQYDQAGNYDVEFSVRDNGDPVEIDVELVTITVGNVNRAPVFDPVGTRQTLEGQAVQFSVQANDPDGNAVTYSTSPLPAGAAFDANTRGFSWTPTYGQAGTYTVTFYATDNGELNRTGETSVVISVNQPPPSELARQTVNTIIELPLEKEVEKSYVAHVKKVDTFIANGQKTPAINQLNSFINKVNQDINKGLISSADGNRLIQMASELIAILNN